MSKSLLSLDCIGNKNYWKFHSNVSKKNFEISISHIIPLTSTNQEIISIRKRTWALLRLCYSSLFRWAAEFPVVPRLYWGHPLIQHGNRKSQQYHGVNGKTIYKWWIVSCRGWNDQRVYPHVFTFALVRWNSQNVILPSSLQSLTSDLVA